MQRSMAGMPVSRRWSARAARTSSATLIRCAARGHGLGSRLVDECHRYARAAGYRKVRLWTTDQQAEARHIYRNKGYVLVAQDAAYAFGKDMVNETWELDL